MTLEVHIDFLRTDPLLLRRMFSSRVLKELGAGKVPGELSAVLASLEAAEQLPPGLTLSQLYNEAFKFCFRHHRVEYFYKNAVVEKLLLGRRSLGKAAAYVEMRIAEAKLDVLLANTHINAYEIKTDFDELNRLPSQIRAYQRACREVTVLTGEKFASTVDSVIPKDVGLSVLTNRYQLRVIRPPSFYDEGLNPVDMLALLRRDELTGLLGEFGEVASNVSNIRLFKWAVQAVAHVSEVEINGAVARRLVQRSKRKRALIEGLPISLAASAVAQDLTRAQNERLIHIFDTDITGGLRGDLSSLLQRQAV